MTKTLERQAVESELRFTVDQLAQHKPDCGESAEDAARILTAPDYATWALAAGDDDLIDVICDIPRGDLTARVSKAFATSNNALLGDWLMDKFRARADRAMCKLVAARIDELAEERL